MRRQFTLEQSRNLAGLTQEDMAEKLGVSAKTYFNYEKYNRYMRMDTAFLFSKITNLSIDEIIFLPKEYGNSVQKSVKER